MTLPTARRLLISASLIGAATAWLSAGNLAPQRGRPVTPRRTVDAVVDGCRIEIEYGGPFKRDRTIWGGLVPWNRWWMPGADNSTSLRTSAPLVIGGLQVPAGEHTIYTLPGPNTFLLIINNEIGTFHTHYNQGRDLGRTPMTLRTVTDPVEEMTFAVEPAPAGGGTLTLSWDDREYSVALSGGATPAAAGAR